MKQTLSPKTIILFGKDNYNHAQRLSGKLKQFESSARLLRCSSMGEVESMIDNFDKSSTILILMLHPEDVGDPFLFMKQKGALNGVRIILVLPEIEDQLMRDYLKLAPSYMAHLESDFDDVCAVMIKMGLRMSN